MVANVTSLTNNGLRDWLIQRVSALVLVVYTIVLLVIFFSYPQLDYVTWRTIFTSMSMRILTILALLSLILHAWIGVWTVLTDYIKPTLFRLIGHIVVILTLISCFVWGIAILWSV